MEQNISRLRYGNYKSVNIKENLKGDVCHTNR